MRLSYPILVSRVLCCGGRCCRCRCIVLMAILDLWLDAAFLKQADLHGQCRERLKLD